MFLQSLVIPIVTAGWSSSPLTAHSFEGTGFVISNAGHFLTARHVIENGLSQAAKAGHELCAVVKGEDGTDTRNGLAQILEYEYAPEPFDVALCQIPYRARTTFHIQQSDNNLWRDVATYGYPQSAVGREMMSSGVRDMALNLRANKGYIQREVTAANGPLGVQPDGLELSFLIGPGMSGAPIFIYKGNFDAVIGIAVGSNRSEILDFEHVEVDESGSKFSERRMKIEEYGFAQSLAAICDWEPALLKGRKLCEAHLIEA